MLLIDLKNILCEIFFESFRTVKIDKKIVKRKTLKILSFIILLYSL